MARQRTGTVYREWVFRSYRRGIGMYRRQRWVAEISVDGIRYRARGTSEAAARAWCSEMAARFPTVARRDGPVTRREKDGRVVYRTRRLSCAGLTPDAVLLLVTARQARETPVYTTDHVKVRGVSLERLSDILGWPYQRTEGHALSLLASGDAAVFDTVNGKMLHVLRDDEKGDIGLRSHRLKAKERGNSFIKREKYESLGK